MKKEQLRELIEETLKEIGLHSQNAVNLLMGTAAQESLLGVYIKQINGPALGIFQMEPNTFRDILDNYLYYHPTLTGKIIKCCKAEHVSPEDIRWNLKLAICFARVHYLRVREALPSTIEGYAMYWKKYYNTHLGKGTESEFQARYRKYVL